VLFAVGVAPDVVDAQMQFERLDSQSFGFDEQSGHKIPSLYYLQKIAPAAAACPEENAPSTGRSRQRIVGEGKFRDDFSTNEMLLNDALQNCRRATVVIDVSML